MKRQPTFSFLLYVAGDTQNSSVAVANLTAFCHSHLAGRHKIEVVDVFLRPDRALADGTFMTPTLIKVGPLPKRKIVGTLNQEQLLLHAIGLEKPAA